MTVRVLIGDVFDRLAELLDESVHCVVTSPPYFALRDYGVEGAIGLVADRLGRDAILIELNPEYADMARARIADDAPLIAEVP